MSVCKVKTKAGKPCKAPPLANGRCVMHQSADAAKELSGKAVEARRREREAAREDAAAILSVPKDGKEVNDTIRQSIGEVRAGMLDPEIARAISQLAGVFFRGLEIVELEARLRALEEKQSVKDGEK
jgi:hypothetical protein